VQVGNGGGFPLLFLGPAVKRKGHGNEEEEGTVGVKRASYPHPRIYTEEVWVVGIVGSVPLPRPFPW
jgi:hypothetical protein